MGEKRYWLSANQDALSWRRSIHITQHWIERTGKVVGLCAAVVFLRKRDHGDEEQQKKEE